MHMSHPRYQVFVSSTFEDLQPERQSITEQLLKLRAIPAGMELFSASGRPPWSVIENALQDTDYMVLVLGGRYGSLMKGESRSYTEREYDYAVAHDIPVLAFVHRDIGALPARFVDADPELVARREAFWSKVKDSERHTVDFWSRADDLAQKVMAAVTAAFRDQPRVGWVRNPDGHGVGHAPHSSTLHVSQVSVPDDETVINAALRSVTELPFLQSNARFSVPADVDVQAEHARRERELEAVARPLVHAVARAARRDVAGTLDRYWVDLIENLSTPPRVSGSTLLIHLVRAPAMLVLNAVGVGAVAGRRSDLVGFLLSPRLQVDSPYRDAEVPAVVELGASLLYAQGWPSKHLGEYLKSAMVAEELDASTFDRAWERWQYLAAVAKVFYGGGNGGSAHLRIEDRPQAGPRPVVARQIRREVEAEGDAHPLLQGGFCGGSAELFAEAAETFDSNYGKWGNERDWDALPVTPGGGRGGILPSGPHFPGYGSPGLT